MFSFFSSAFFLHQNLLIAQKRIGIFYIKRTQRHIHKGAALVGSLFNDVQVVGRKYNRQKLADKLTVFETERPFFFSSLDLSLKILISILQGTPPLSYSRQIHALSLPYFYKLFLTAAAERLQVRAKCDTFQNIRLSLCIFSRKHIDAVLKVYFFKLYISEIFQRQS